MNRPDVPDDYEDRLAAGRRAAARLPEGPARDSALRALERAPSREEYDRACERAASADAIVEELTQSGFDGADHERVAWLRLDYTGRLRMLAFSPTIDRLSNPVAAEAVAEAWTAAESARAESARRMEPHAAPMRTGPEDPAFARFRAELEAGSGERFEHTTDDDLCSAAVNLEGRLTDFKFLVPNATLDYECEFLAEQAAATIQLVQARASERLAEVASRCFE